MQEILDKKRQKTKGDPISNEATPKWMLNIIHNYFKQLFKETIEHLSDMKKYIYIN